MPKPPKSITKLDIAAELASATGLSRKQGEKVLERLAYVVRTNLRKHNTVVLYGLGRFEMVPKRARNIKLPATTETVLVPEHHAPHFRISGQLKADLSRFPAPPESDDV